MNFLNRMFLQEIIQSAVPITNIKMNYFNINISKTIERT